MLQKPCLPVQSPATPKTPAVTLQRRKLAATLFPPACLQRQGCLLRRQGGEEPPRRDALAPQSCCETRQQRARLGTAGQRGGPAGGGERCSTLRTTYVPSARVLAIFGVEMKMKVNKQRFSSVFSLSAVLPMSSAVPPSPPRHPGSMPEPMLLV